MGYIILILCFLILVPVVFIMMSKRAGRSSAEGQRPIGKPVMVDQPAADEPTPAASSIRKDTSEAQRRTPAA